MAVANRNLNREIADLRGPAKRIVTAIAVLAFAIVIFVPVKYFINKNVAAKQNILKLIEIGDMESLAFKLKNNPEDLNALRIYYHDRNNYEESTTALKWAVKNKQYAAVELLLSKGAQPVPMINGKKYLDALFLSNDRSLTLLLAAGADPNTSDAVLWARGCVVDNETQTLLQHKALVQDHKAVRVLLAHGASPLPAPRPVAGARLNSWTLMQIACRIRNPDLMKVVLEMKAYGDIKAVDSQGRTALDLVIDEDWTNRGYVEYIHGDYLNLSCVQQLLEAGADRNQEDLRAAYVAVIGIANHAEGKNRMLALSIGAELIKAGYQPSSDEQRDFINSTELYMQPVPVLPIKVPESTDIPVETPLTLEELF